MGRGRVKRRSPPSIEQFAVVMRDAALRRLRIINSKSNRITSFRQSSDFSHDLGRRLSLDNGWLLLVPRATLAQAEKPLRPAKNGSIQGWNDPRHPLAGGSFGAVPAVAPTAGVPHCFKWVPIRGGCAEVRPGEMFSGRDGANKAADSESPMITHLRRIQPDAGFQHRPCAQFCAYDRLGAVGKGRNPWFFSDSSGTRNPRLVAGFSVVSFCIYLDNIGSGRGI